jgi:hypothetical protein
VRRAAGVAALAVVLAGCGSGAENEARETVGRWLAALAKSDGAAACELVAPELAERARPSCEVVYGGYGEVIGERLGQAGLDVERVVRAEPDAVRVAVAGDQASATIAEAPFDAILLRRTDEGWRVVRGLVPAS